MRDVAGAPQGRSPPSPRRPSSCRWPDALNAVLGFWLAASPWVLGFDSDGRLLLAATATGAALLAAAIGALTHPGAWEEWDIVLVGVAAVASPSMIDPGADATVRGSFVIAGSTASLLAGWSLLANARRPTD